MNNNNNEPMPEITFEDVKNGIQSGVIYFVMGDFSIACQIGDFWFYFASSEDEDLTVNEYLEEYTLDEQAEQVFAVLSDWETSGLSEDETKYYISVILGL